MTPRKSRTIAPQKKKGDSSGLAPSPHGDLEVSIVLPVFNSQDFIAANITRLKDFCRSNFSSFEIIAVDDGSRDRTREVLESLPSDNLAVVGLKANAGKWAALAAGMSRTRGRCCIFTDSDLPFNLSVLPYIARLINERDWHIVIGDRNLPQSVYNINTSRLRNVSTRVFSMLVNVLVTSGLFDTQCGLKGFRGDVARAIFPLVTDPGFSGDVELLYIALKYNLEIKRIPVRLVGHGPSTVRLFSHALGMLWKVSQLRLNWNKGLYDSGELRRISSQKYWD